MEHDSAFAISIENRERRLLKPLDLRQHTGGVSAHQPAELVLVAPVHRPISPLLRRASQRPQHGVSHRAPKPCRERWPALKAQHNTNEHLTLCRGPSKALLQVGAQRMRRREPNERVAHHPPHPNRRQRRGLALGARLTQRELDALGQVEDPKWLLDIGKHAQPRSARPGLIVRVGRDHDDRDTGRDRVEPQRLDHLEAAPFWHRHIEQEQIVSPTKQLHNGPRAVLDLLCLVPLDLAHLGEEPAVVRVVISDEHTNQPRHL